MLHPIVDQALAVFSRNSTTGKLTFVEVKKDNGMALTAWMVPVLLQLVRTEKMSILLPAENLLSLYLIATQVLIPEITSPTPGSTLSSSTETFEWTSGADEYWLWVGSSAGEDNIYNSGSLGRNTSDTVYNLPTDGSKIYVRL